MTEYRLRWSHGEAVVLSTAAVLADCRFDLPSGPFRPYARAPWMGTVDDPAIIGHLRELGGDFVCVPFGIARSAPVGPADWAALMTDPAEPPIHGPAGDAEWALVEQAEHSVTLGLDYPEGALVARLERTVAGRPGSPVLESRLRILPNRSGTISIGLHPILRLPERQGALRLDARFAFGLTHPAQTAAGQQQEFTDLARVPQPDGWIDLTHLPVDKPNVSVQLCGMEGPFRASFLDEGAGVELDWDRSILPSLQIWFTDRGIDGAPWHRRYRGVGTEPIASAFDLGAGLSTRDNPISRRGIATAVSLRAGEPLEIDHFMTAFALEGRSSVNMTNGS